MLNRRCNEDFPLDELNEVFIDSSVAMKLSILSTDIEQLDMTIHEVYVSPAMMHLLTLR
jgi:hypothetical protein